MSDFWLYRGFVYNHDFNGKRCIFGETAISLEPETNQNDAKIGVTALLNGLTAPLGFSGDGSLYWFHFFVERIWPLPHWSTLTRPIGLTNLNPAAPEAAFRLQRVGALGGIGRVTVPIPNDSYYVDLPHRRKVNVAAIQPVMRGALANSLTPYTYAGRTYRNVLFHRSTKTWENVVRYDLLENPIRVWQRWRNYDRAHRPTDTQFVPPEIEKHWSE